MSIDDTYVPIFRSLLNHRYMRDATKLQFWVWCLLKASHKEHKVLVGNQTITLEIGQFIFGRKTAAEEMGLTEQSIRTLLKFFSSSTEQKLTIKSTNKFSVITVIDYASYMDKVKQINQQFNQHLTSKQPAPNHKQEGKEGKEKPPYEFDEFWKAYPKKKNKGQAEKAWLKIKQPSETLQKILEALKWQKASQDWTKENGQFIPHPATYLNGRAWEDERPQPQLELIPAMRGVS